MPSPESEPPKPPPFFIDRSLGRIDVPNALIDAGFDIQTLWSRYGPGAEETIEDAVWLRDVGLENRVVLSKDKRVRWIRHERRIIEEFSVKVFTLARGSLTSVQQVERFLRNMDRIVKRCQNPGHFVDVVHPDEVVRKWPKQ